MPISFLQENEKLNNAINTLQRAFVMIRQFSRGEEVAPHTPTLVAVQLYSHLKAVQAAGPEADAHYPPQLRALHHIVRRLSQNTSGWQQLHTGAVVGVLVGDPTNTFLQDLYHSLGLTIASFLFIFSFCVDW